MKEDEMVRACSMYRKEEEYIQGFGKKIWWRERNRKT
jgi:hypothetical protein